MKFPPIKVFFDKAQFQKIAEDFYSRRDIAKKYVDAIKSSSVDIDIWNEDIESEYSCIIRNLIFDMHNQINKDYPDLTKSEISTVIAMIGSSARGR